MTANNLTLQDQIEAAPPGGLILCGPAGIGKAAFAREIAARLLGCAPDFAHPDLHIVRAAEDKKAIDVEQVRDACQRIRLAPADGGHRVMLVPQADTMTVNAANALLKTLEEPPARATVILTVDAVGRLPATIRSRCRLERVAAPARDAALAQLRETCPDLSVEEGRGLLELAQGRAGLAADYAAAGGIELYLDICRAAKPLIRPGGRVDRPLLIALTQRAGKSWPTAVNLIERLAARLSETLACGEPPAAAMEGEDKFLQAIARHARLSASVSAWTDVRRLGEEAEVRNLDGRTTLDRALRALDALAATPAEQAG
ncbi:hypothetical protein CKO28_04730 [Rhodovibrio sodomensis]|uniref:AAA+ ATPase domain-containing protein n=1 Tax=Rhodovibrio sodomensis TaxID=1088 RepID=A0ABS1DA74_9PROT|nr:AAA family ATPase [Rhodovibrio sodomensis]MBK1667333.1 hypothetical protein [Rhodovibrio sodomensis]